MSALITYYCVIRGFSGGSLAENPLVMQEAGVWSLGQEDPLEEGTATLSSILAWTEEPGRLPSTESQKSRTLLKQLSTHAHTR